MKLMITGTRTGHVSFDRFDQFVSGHEGELIVVTGDATGVDACARMWAVERGYPLVLFCAGSLRDLEPVVAGYTRLNVFKRFDGRAFSTLQRKDAAAYANVLAAYWDGKSPGTESTIEFFKAFGKPVAVEVIEEVL